MLSEDLITSVRNRGMLPLSDTTLTTGTLLTFATEEMQSDLVPAVKSVREDFYTSYRDYPPPADDSVELPIPSRAIGNSIRNVHLYISPGQVSDVPRRQLEEISKLNLGYYVMNNGIRLLNRFSLAANSVRVYFYLRPASLVPSDQAARVVSVSGSTLTLDSVPAGFTSGALYDVVQSRSPFGTLVWDATGTISGNVLTLSSGYQSPGDALSGLSAVQAGDAVSLAGQTPVVQLPLELQPALSQATVCRCLEAIGDREGLAAAYTRYQQMRKIGLDLIGNRADTSPNFIVPSYSPARAWY